jgi:hypothetical protein
MPSSIVVMPPMPEPMMTAVLGPAMSFCAKPACAIASSAATTQNCVKGSQKARTLGSI